MGNDECKLKVSVGNSEGNNLKVELVGTEAFVKEYEEKFSLEEKVRELADTESSTSIPQQSSQSTEEESLYPHVFDLSGKKTRIISKIPGTSTADKQSNIALLYLLGTKLKTGSEAKISFKELEDICKGHDCPDEHINSTFRREKRSKYFDIEKKGRQDSLIKLTPDGKEEAHKLAKQLNDEQAAS